MPIGTTDTPLNLAEINLGQELKSFRLWHFVVSNDLPNLTAIAIHDLVIQAKFAVCCTEELFLKC